MSCKLVLHVCVAKARHRKSRAPTAMTWLCQFDMALKSCADNQNFTASDMSEKAAFHVRMGFAAMYGLEFRADSHADAYGETQGIS